MHTGYRALAGFWDDTRLRIGDTVSADLASTSHGGPGWIHPNKWQSSGTVRVAFESIGAVVPHACRSTHRTLDAVAVTSAAG